MKSEIELINHIEAYLRGELSPEEQSSFEQLRNKDSEIDHKVVAHHNLMKQIAAYGDYRQFKVNMKNIHNQLDIDTLKSEVLPPKSRIKTLWYKYRMTASVAASVAVLAAFLTLLSVGYFTNSNTDPNYNLLNRRVDKVDQKLNQVINSKSPVNPGKFAATGFALTTNGYVITNYHVIQNADSVYIQNTDGESFKVKTVYANSSYDIAILQITDPNFKSFKSLPYTIKRPSSDMGEPVYTLGFPTPEPTYNEGYLSAQTGYKGDTITYRVAISVNPGNSGGPLLDNRGNIIGIISAKQTQADGASFAVKSEYLLKSIKDLQDSLEVKLVLNKRNSLSALTHTAQIKKMQKYIFMVKAY